jgi:glycosyltransferase involved in cell wall biosynthesis
VKICQVVNIGHEAGGAEKSVRLLADGMRRRGHDVTVIATDHHLRPAASFADVVVPAVRGNAAGRLCGFFWNHAAHREVKRAMAAVRPDVVHLHTIGMFSPSVLSATAGRPRVLTVHGPEDWTLHLLSWNLQSRSLGDGTLSRGDRARYLYLRFLQRPAYLARLRRIDRVLAPSAYYSDVVRADVGRVPTYVLPNGIDLPTSTPAPDSHRLLYIGRHERTKGLHVLVEAFSRIAHRHPDAELVLVGDGPRRAELEDLARRSGGTRITFTGWLVGDALREQLAGAAAVVVPSIGPENLPTVAIEALGVGRAIIGSRIGGLPELVLDGENGELVEPGDAGALAAALDRALGDPALLQRMGARSAALAGNYSIELFLDRVERHYVELVSARPGTT